MLRVRTRSPLKYKGLLVNFKEWRAIAEDISGTWAIPSISLMPNAQLAISIQKNKKNYRAGSLGQGQGQGQGIPMAHGAA